MNSELPLEPAGMVRDTQYQGRDRTYLMTMHGLMRGHGSVCSLKYFAT